MLNNLKDKETTRKLLSLYVKNLKGVVQACEAIKNSVAKFDKKVYNARFINTIKEVLETQKLPFYAYERGEGDIKIGFRDRYITEGCNAIYLRYDEAYITNNYYGNEINYIGSDKRINIQNFYKQVDKQVEYFNAQIKDIEQGIRDLPIIIAKYNRIKADIDAFNSINYVVLKELNAYID